MPQHPDSPEPLVCEHCEHPFIKDDPYCKCCGALYEDHAHCSTHEEIDAVGVCTACIRSCCPQCGRLVDGIFLRAFHAQDEHYEGQAQVLGEQIYGRTIPEQKVLVPYSEIRQAETIFHELEILS